MDQNLDANCFAMLILAFTLYFTTGHAKVLGHTSPLKPSTSGMKSFSWQKWTWPWS
nr:ATP synthase F0 subunit 8 [Trematomus pennellii]